MKKTSLQTLFGLSHSTASVGCSASVMTALLSKQLAPDIAILAISYPEVDERNHRSLDALAHKLLAHGFNDAAESVRAYAPFILFEDLSLCVKVLQEFRQDSCAINAHLYYNGETGSAAENALNALLHPVERPALAHAA